jgi:exosortase A-associated hydrolase 1
MTWHERALTFNCQGEQLFGVLATPSDQSRATGTGVLVVVGGPQYRVGAHRQFVQFARALAAAGHSVLRFDVRGMGDSTGAQRSFEVLSDDTKAAIDALFVEAPCCTKLALMGLCDGASAALMYVHDTGDCRIDGLCLLNPWLRSDETLARTQVKHYYLRRITSLHFWRKLVRGGVGLGALRDFVRTLGTTLKPIEHAVSEPVSGRAGLDFRAAMLQGFKHFQGPVLLGLSSDDLTAKEFVDATVDSAGWREVLAGNQVHRVPLEPADHTLSQRGARLRFEAAVLAWLDDLPVHGAV